MDRIILRLKELVRDIDQYLIYLSFRPTLLRSERIILVRDAVHNLYTHTHSHIMCTTAAQISRTPRRHRSQTTKTHRLSGKRAHARARCWRGYFSCALVARYQNAKFARRAIQVRQRERGHAISAQESDACFACARASHIAPSHTDTETLTQ